MTRGDELKPGDVIRFARTWHTITEIIPQPDGLTLHADGLALHVTDGQGHASRIDTAADSRWETKA